GDDVPGLVGEARPVVSEDCAGNDNVASVVGIESKGAVLLQTFTQSVRDVFAKARFFEDFILENIDLDRARAGREAIGGADAVPGAAGRGQDPAEEAKVNAKAQSRKDARTERAPTAEH